MSGMCGVLGIENAAEHVVLALGGGLEHRGAHKTGATGVVSQYIGEDGIQHQHSHRGYGAVGTVYFEQNDVARLTGECALGYVGPAEPLLSIHDIPPYGQRFPFIGREDARIAICYDGVITNKKDLCQEAVSGGYALTSPKSPVVFLANLLAQHTGRSGGTLVVPDEPNALYNNLLRQVATSITDRVFVLAQKLQGTLRLRRWFMTCLLVYVALTGRDRSWLADSPTVLWCLRRNHALSISLTQNFSMKSVWERWLWCMPMARLNKSIRMLVQVYPRHFAP